MRRYFEGVSEMIDKRTSKRMNASDKSLNRRFERIEAVLEELRMEELAQILSSEYRRLEQLVVEDHESSQLGVSDVMIAYERVADLFEYLYSVKEVVQKSDLARLDSNVFGA